MKKQILLGFLLLFTLCASAQSIEQSVGTNQSGQGHVVLHLSPSVQRSLSKPMDASTWGEQEEEESIDEKMRKAREFRDAEKRKAKGYRILVYAGGNSRSDKQKAEQVGEHMKRLFPYYPVYSHFESPRWVCRLGNFVKREEANAVMEKVREAGYRQAVVTEDIILIAK